MVRDILEKDIKLNPYAEYFAEQSSSASPEEKQMIERLNYFNKLLMEAINRGKPYDVGEMADQAGIDYEDAKGIVASVKRMIERNRTVK